MKFNKYLFIALIGMVSLVSFTIVTKKTSENNEVKKVERQFNNSIFNEFSAEESRSFMSNFGLMNTLVIDRPATWFGTNGAQVFPTAVVPNRQEAKMMDVDIMEQIGEVTASTSFGELKLDEFLNHADALARGFVVAHKGKIVYEQYPGMLEDDVHVTASAAKVLAGLLIEVLIEEGLVDEQKAFGEYVSDFIGTAWEDVKVIDIMDMATGLDPIDGPAHFANPASVTARMLRAELGEAYNGEVELMTEVMKLAKSASEPGTQFTYSSTATQALVLLTEAATNQSWADAFDQRIWSKIGAESPLQVHLSPDGYALGHGFLSIKLRDLARFGMLYTPSWESIAYEQVVTPEVLERTRAPYRTKEFYRAGPSAESFMKRLGDDSVVTAGRQWDAIWEDGDFFKSGFNTQGIYVSPDRDLVIAYFSTESTQQLQKYLRPLATSGIFNN